MKYTTMLSQQDSNLYKQNQNLLCYHYTMGQVKKPGAKIHKKMFLQTKKIKNCKYFIFFQ